MVKNGTTFWKVWRSKFEYKNKPLDVEGCSDVNIIADKFAVSYHCCSANILTRTTELQAEFTSMRVNYCGSAFTDQHLFDVDLISNIIFKLKCGKAAGFDSFLAVMITSLALKRASIALTPFIPSEIWLTVLLMVAALSIYVP